MQVTQLLCSTQTVNITDNQLNHRLASFRSNLLLLYPLFYWTLTHWSHLPFFFATHAHNHSHTFIFNLPLYFKAASSITHFFLSSLLFFSHHCSCLKHLHLLFYSLFDLHIASTRCAFVVLCTSIYAVKRKAQSLTCFCS